MPLFNTKSIFVFSGALFLVGCSSFPMINETPQTFTADQVFQNETSSVAFRVSLSNAVLDDELNKLERLSFSVGLGPSLRAKGTSLTLETNGLTVIQKTKNPLYNPKKWLETKNPTYNPKKWLKACFIKCIKTKNLFYDPKKWIKTKNPLYSPNKFISVEWPGSISEINAEASIDGNINYTPYNGNRANFEVPVKAKGEVTLVVPPIVLAAKTPFDGRVVASIDVGFSPSSDWCIRPDVETSYKWDERLSLDYSYGLGLLEIDVTKEVEGDIKDKLKDLEKTITDSVDCDDMRNSALAEWHPRKIQLDYTNWALIVPKSASLSNVQFTEEDISISGEFISEISVASGEPKLPPLTELPLLQNISATSPGLNLNVPIELSYEFLENSIADSLKNQPIVFGSEGLGGQATIHEVKLFPSGDLLGIKVKFSTKGNPGLLSVKATSYFTGDIRYSANGNADFLTYDLNTLKFNEYGSIADALVLRLAYKSIKRAISDSTEIEITKELNSARENLRKLAERLDVDLSQNSAAQESALENSGLELPSSSITINNWYYSDDALKFNLRAKAVTN